MLLDEIGARLTAQSVASTSAGSTGWRLVYRDLQPTPARQVCVVLTGGLPQDGEAPIDRPTFQVMVRGSSADGSALATEARVQRVVNALNLFDGTLTGSSVPRVYVDIQKQGDTFYLGRDAHQRPLYSVNFLAVRSRTT